MEGMSMNWFEEIRRFTRNMMREFEEMFNDELLTEPSYEKPFVYGYSVFIGPNGVPVIREFGTPLKARGSKVGKVRYEPYHDVIVDEEKGTVTITVEVPGVDKQDITVKVAGENIRIKGSTKGREFEKVIPLNSEVDKESIKATYKNGILEITAKLKTSDSDSREIKVE
ncbi:MAG: Hsp20 family protein [Candidatus Odinarchaeum yellowstonii]|uniref:Hsp20 family protein n=1 Tax=Odinarchaeota yellowstonii (strain LCB_4) TaxID=1841599 RepID=A0AAF0D2W2_ODILC|nr:MAG: Hsp20 family protein [Candidatus Odinarchaeum yellowstonii]